MGTHRGQLAFLRHSIGMAQSIRLVALALLFILLAPGVHAAEMIERRALDRSFPYPSEDQTPRARPKLVESKSSEPMPMQERVA